MHSAVASLLPSSISLRIGLAPDGIALLKTQGLWRPQTSVVANSNASILPATLRDALTRLLADGGCINAPATVIVADQWVRLFMVTPAQNSSSLDDCKAAAAMRFQQLYGSSLDGWQLNADWQVHAPFLACAMPNALLQTLEQVAREHRLTLLSVVPQFIAAWNRWRKQLEAGAWFALHHADTLTLAVLDQNRLHVVRASVLPQAAMDDAQWLNAHVKREALRLNVAPPHLVQLCGVSDTDLAAHARLTPNWIRLDAKHVPLQAGRITAAQQLARTGLAS